MLANIYAVCLTSAAIAKEGEFLVSRIEDINSIESEAGVIASLIHTPELYYHVDSLLPNHFFSVENRCIYSAIIDLLEKGIKTIDPYNIVEVLSANEATRKISEDITVEKLQELFDMSDTLARTSVEEYKMLTRNIFDSAFRRDIYNKLRECERLCLKESEDDIQQRIYTEIDNVFTSYSNVDEIPQYADVVDGLWSEIKSRQGNGYAGIPFKFPALNDYVTIERGELVIFAAQQKVGKSIMLLNCAVDLLKKGYSVLYIDSELSSRLFTARLLSHLSEVEYRKLVAGSYNKEEEQKIESAREWMKTRKFTHLYMPFFDQQGIYAAVKKIDHVQHLDVIIIDYFKSTGNEVDAFQTYAAMGRCVSNIGAR